jgi:aryl-alcohol dehydrogenase-like predicted oxidoreductase
MGMSEFYGAPDDQQSLHALETAFDLGYRHFDTADMYGAGHNEKLLGSFLTRLGSRRDEVVVASKVGIRRDLPGPSPIGIDSTPEYVRAACERSLERLGVERIDLYYLHRRNPAVPIEDTMGAMAALLSEGKIGAIGLSEVSVETLRKAARVAPIAALQSEYSLWTRDAEGEMFGACAELGVTFVAYSPVGRGFLSGELQAETVRTPGDLRGMLPRFQPGAFESNARLLEVVARVARALDASRAQVALAWVLAKNPALHAIPGTRKATHLSDNWGSQKIALSPSHMEELSRAFHAEAVTGLRYPEPLLRTTGT